jgi:O-antigen/teichoic acid export membrane protein
MSWFLWAVLLLIQNASFTMVSRARNSKSLTYHALAAVLSNGVWFLSLAVAVNKLNDALAAGSAWAIVGTAAFYTVFTVIGSVGMHHLLMTKVEK